MPELFRSSKRPTENQCLRSRYGVGYTSFCRIRINSKHMYFFHENLSKILEIVTHLPLMKKKNLINWRNCEWKYKKFSLYFNMCKTLGRIHNTTERGRNWWKPTNKMQRMEPVTSITTRARHFPRDSTWIIRSCVPDPIVRSTDPDSSIIKQK